MGVFVTRGLLFRASIRVPVVGGTLNWLGVPGPDLVGARSLFGLFSLFLLLFLLLSLALLDLGLGLRIWESPKIRGPKVWIQDSRALFIHIRVYLDLQSTKNHDPNAL